MTQSQDYINDDGEQVQAMLMSPELITVISAWCHGVVVEEIHPHDDQQRFPALNLRTRDGAGRASMGDYVIKHEDGSFEVKRPGEFIRSHVPNSSL
jgi:hypothetical protein